MNTDYDHTFRIKPGWIDSQVRHGIMTILRISIDIPGSGWYRDTRVDLFEHDGETQMWGKSKVSGTDIPC